MGLFAEIAYGPSPSFSAGGATTGAPLPAGTYTYMAAFNLAAGVAGLSAQVPVAVSGAGGVGVTITPAFVPAGATGYQVYRTVRGGGAFYQITGSPFALSQAGTQFVDATSDATLVGNTALPAAVQGGILSTQRLKELTNPDTPQGTSTGPNYSVLQSVVWQAQAFFFGETGVPYDDTTPSGPPPVVPTNQPAPVFPPAGGNVCHWCGVGIVIAMLYDYRAQAFPQPEVDAAWKEARARLTRWKTQWGSVRWAAPGTDSTFTPSTQTGPQPILPSFDNERLSQSLPNSPQPFQGPAGASFGWGPGGL